MSEVYPSDSELLNIITDEVTGVEYIATGQAPYYLQFRKMLYRLLLVCRLANEFRVYREDGLNVGVKPGSFRVGTELVDYGGSSGNTLADNQEAIYLYLDGSGQLVTNEYSGFPSMSQEPHMRLAVVKTASGEVDEITDERGSGQFVMPSDAGGQSRSIESHTGDDTLEAFESGSLHSNLGATGPVTLTLPSGAEAGTYFTFGVQASEQLRVEPGSSAIRDDSGTSSGKYKYADSVGACITLTADENGDWVTSGKNGTWSEEV